jgi:hypothetical protein
MKKQTLIVAVCASAIFLFLFRGWFSSSDEKAIDRLLENIEIELEFTQALKTLEIAGRINRLSKLIDKDIYIKFDDGSNSRNFTGFDSVKTGALTGSQLIQSSDIQRLATDIKVSGDRASAQFMVIGSGLDSTGDSIKERFRVSTTLIQFNNEWTLSEITILRDVRD